MAEIQETTPDRYLILIKIFFCSQNSDKRLTFTPVSKSNDSPHECPIILQTQGTSQPSSPLRVTSTEILSYFKFRFKAQR